MRLSLRAGCLVILVFCQFGSVQGASPAAAPTCALVQPPLAAHLDRDLQEVTVGQLQAYYAQRRYTVSQVVSWYLSRVQTLNPKYKALVRVYADDALARAAAQDVAMCRGERRGPLWGVPIVIKANTNIAGKITDDGWEGYTQPGAEFVARRNASVVDLFERAGAIVVGHGNMPDLAKSDSNVSSVGGRTGNAYDVNYSPGGSSGGVAVAIALNMVILGQGSDTGNSIRNPASNASIVGVFPTGGMIRLSGIHPYDVLLDNTGPMARTVTDAAIALDVMAGLADPAHATVEATEHRPPGGSYTSLLKRGALKGKRFGVPHFILAGSPNVHPNPRFNNRGSSAETRAVFMKAVERMRALGATVLIQDDILPEAFDRIADSFDTKGYRAAGIEQFLREEAPENLNSFAKIEMAGKRFPLERFTDGAPQTTLSLDPQAEAKYFAPRRRLIAMYQDTLKRMKLDGFVYPALQVPPNDERVALPADYPTDGPYSNTNWLNRLRAPSVVVPAGFYSNGLPFGVEISGDFWKDGELLGYAYDFERATRARHAPSPLNR